jgi:nitroreductase
MVTFSKPITEIVKQRFSCRDYLKTPIDTEKRERLAEFIAANQTGPLGSPTRFGLTAATEADQKALRGLGTYGFIKNPMGFILGAMGEGEKNLEDFGYTMERIILFATDLDLGTCWLGGSFTKSRFARRNSAKKDERVPAVTSVGYCAESTQDGAIRQRVGGAHRYAWDTLFFDQAFSRPLSQEEAGTYAMPLEAVRLGPSASNKQPWRVVKENDAWHFYIQRTPGYRNQWIMKLLNIDDMQRLDAGIAMCHFELTANESGLEGDWTIDEPSIQKTDGLTEYIASWREM